MITPYALAPEVYATPICGDPVGPIKPEDDNSESALAFVHALFYKILRK
jgi:hypothetical protein